MTRTSSGALPIDAAIPQLSRLTRPPEVARLLGTVLMGGPQSWMACSNGLLNVQAVTVLRGHPGSRWTLRYSIRRGEEEITVFAKVYARDRSDVATTLSVLRSRGLGLGQPMQVAAPIAYVPTLRLLLLEEASGRTARAALRRGQGGIGEKTAHWLAAFHAAAAAPRTVAHLQRDPLIKARRWAQALGANAPALGREANNLLAALVEAQPAWRAPPHLVHGDFSASHVYLAAETTTVIDWDSWRVGDCAEDAGRFMASLHYLAASDPERHVAVTQTARTFARTYQAAVPMARRSLAFYEAFACLRKAARLTAKSAPHRLHRAAALLAAGERTLASRSTW
jgi:Phosphotransferase enzyme family